MLFPTEIRYTILFPVIQSDFMKFVWINSLVSKEFHQTTIEIKLYLLQSLSVDNLEMKVEINNYVGYDWIDIVDYLTGNFRIGNYTMENLKDVGYYSNDDNILYQPVILSNLKLGNLYGPDLIDIDNTYHHHIKYNDTSNDTIKYSVTNYWLYIFEEQCHYCKSYSYMLLPYYHNKINNWEDSQLYDIYELKLHQNTFIDL